MDSVHLEIKSPDVPEAANEVLGKYKYNDLDAETTFLLAYSPSRCAFAKWNGEKFIDLDGSEIEGVYEFRLFNADFELRWVKIAKDDKGIGRYVKIAESQNGETYRSMPGKYLLWGKWNTKKSALCERRIGILRIPVLKNITDGAELALALEYVEYFRIGEYGGLEFAAERLTGLQVV